MSTPFPPQAVERSSGPEPRKLRSPAWLREPLLHFFVLGALLFTVDHFLIGRGDDPRTIVVGPEADREALQVFKAARGREPNADELQALRRVWLDNEVLYREGLALNLDKGDAVIRERVIFKALSTIEASVKLPPVDDKLLRAWFENNRAKYDEPARYDFQEAVLSGENSESALRSFVDALNAGTPGEAKAGLRVYRSRPRENLVTGYGADFPKALEDAPPGEWRAIKTRDGWRAIRLDTVTPPKPANFDLMRGPVQQDWADATAQEQRSAAVLALTKKYRVKVEALPK